MTAYYTINGTMAAPLTSFSVPPHYIIVHIKVLTKKIKLELGVEPSIFRSIGPYEHEVLPGFEPRFRDSKSLVITITL
jgi:hypothetical protein